MDAEWPLNRRARVRSMRFLYQPTLAEDSRHSSQNGQRVIIIIMVVLYNHVICLEKNLRILTNITINVRKNYENDDDDDDNNNNNNNLN